MKMFWFISGEWINTARSRSSFFWYAGTTTVVEGDSVEELFLGAKKKAENERPEWAHENGTNMKIVSWTCQPNEIKTGR